jgi:hypothetical protein
VGKRPSGRCLGPVGDLARSSLLAVVSASATGCLVTDVPPYTEPTPTRPFMLESSAIPPTSQIQRFEDRGDGYEPVGFNVDIISEDTTDVVARFYLAGRSNLTPLAPDSSPGGTVEQGTLTGGIRKLEFSWFPPIQQPTGCYELFWLASHDFSAATDCPEDQADYTQVSWTVLICPGECGDVELRGCVENIPQQPCRLQVDGGATQ